MFEYFFMGLSICAFVYVAMRLAQGVRLLGLLIRRYLP
jgi:hypothetical protein